MFHINDLKKINKLIEVYASCRVTIQTLDSFIASHTQQGPDCGGPSVFPYGYQSFLFFNDERNSKSNRFPMIDLRGCYLAIEVAEGIRNVVIGRRNQVETLLNEYGVECK